MEGFELHSGLVPVAADPAVVDQVEADSDLVVAGRQAAGSGLMAVKVLMAWEFDLRLAAAAAAVVVFVGSLVEAVLLLEESGAVGVLWCNMDRR